MCAEGEVRSTPRLGLVCGGKTALAKVRLAVQYRVGVAASGTR